MAIVSPIEPSAALGAQHDRSLEETEKSRARIAKHHCKTCTPATSACAVAASDEYNRNNGLAQGLVDQVTPDWSVSGRRGLRRYPVQKTGKRLLMSVVYAVAFGRAPQPLRQVTPLRNGKSAYPPCLLRAVEPDADQAHGR